MAFARHGKPQPMPSKPKYSERVHPPTNTNETLPAIQSRIARFGQGTDEHYSIGLSTDEQYKLQLQQRQNSNELRYQRGFNT
jgi:hypothetical protein